MRMIRTRLRQPLTGRAALLASWLGTTLALVLYLRRPLGGQLGLGLLALLTLLLVALALAASTISLRRAARHAGAPLTIRSHLSWLSGAMIASGLGIVALAPLRLVLDTAERGRVASAVPRINLLLALMSLALLPVCNTLHWRLGWLSCYLSYEINTLLALFNLLPLQNIAGAHILQWDQVRFAGLSALSCLLFVVQYLPIGKILVFHFGWN